MTAMALPGADVRCLARKHMTLLLLLMAVVGTCCYYYYYGSQLSCCYIAHNPPAPTFRNLHQNIVPKTILAFESKEKNLPLPNCKEPPLSTLPEVESSSVPNEEQGHWHRVNSDSEWYVYSAHTDLRQPEKPVARIVAMAKGRSVLVTPLYCQWWHTNGSLSITHVQKQELWIQSWDSLTGKSDFHYYHPFLLTCSIPKSAKGSDYHQRSVSIVGKACDRHTTHLFHLATPPPKEKLGGFVVCLKPLNFGDNDIHPRLMEWLELQHILGADRIHVYVYQLHPDTWRVLRHYAHMGKVILQNHTLPGVDVDNRRKDLLWQKRRHEMAIYNDCFYRHIHSHAFVVNLDLDEAIVPVRHDTWHDLLAEFTNSQHSASVSVRNVYFFDSFGQIDDDFGFALLPRKQTQPGHSRVQLTTKNDVRPQNQGLLLNSNLPALLYNSVNEPVARQIQPNHSRSQLANKVLRSRQRSSTALQKFTFPIPSISTTTPIGKNSDNKGPEPRTFGEPRGILPPGHLHMLRHVIRSANFTPPGFAQKSFFSTQLAEAVSNHYALRALHPDVRLLSGLDTESARLHHYRKSCPALMEKECDEDYERFRKKDTLLWKYRNRLVQSVLRRMGELGFLVERDFRVATKSRKKSTLIFP